MKTYLAAAAFAAAALISGSACAHGAQPRHGGVVASAGDLAFELVARDGKAVIHVADHGRALATRGGSGKLTVLRAGKKSESALEPAGQDTLVSTQPVQLGAGTKAVAAITLPGRDPISVRFSLR